VASHGRRWAIGHRLRYRRTVPVEAGSRALDYWEGADPEVCRCHTVGHGHAPAVEDEFAHLGIVNGVEAHADPVLSKIRRRGMVNLRGSQVTSASRSPFGNAKPITVSSRENAR
jgi:hypothetical protein